MTNNKIINNNLVFSIIILIVLISSSFGGRPSRVDVKKCCSLNEHLNIDNKQCESGNVDDWKPKILLINKKVYFEPQGYGPQFIDFKPNKKPENCSSEPKIFTSPNIVILSNGSLFLSQKSIFIDINNYCADKDSALVCLPQNTRNNSESQIKKCCGPDHVYNIDKKTCYLNKLSSFNNYQNNFENSIFNNSDIEIIYGFPECELATNDYHIVDEFNLNFFDKQNGSLILKDGKTFSSAEYCLENTVSDFNDITKGQILSSHVVNIFVCANHKEFLRAEIFTPNETSYNANNKILAISICLLISVLFLAATLGAGFLMPPSYHALHWRCQMYYVTCLLVGDFLLAMGQLFGSMIQGAACVCIAILIHFSFLAAFFWLNVMCINIWWTFRDFRPTTLERNQEKLRLIIYSIYAWGGSITIAGVAAILDQLPDDPSYNFLRPRFGEHHCWFYGEMEKFAYFFGPIGILLVINLALFASTAQQLTCGLWKMEEVKSTNENFEPKYSRSSIGRLCLKLVIVMGVTWIADIISWVVGADGHNMEISSYGVKLFLWYGIWYIMDFINALQGVFIFVVVALQPQVWSAIKRIWSIKSVRGVAETNITHQHHSNSSHGMPSIGETVTNNTCTNPVITKIPLETIPKNSEYNNQ